MKTIDPRIHQVLDGELTREVLPPDALRQLEALERAALVLASPSTSRSVAGEVMAEIRRPLPFPQRLAVWVMRPRPVTLGLRPAYALAAALAFVAVGLAVWRPTLGVPRFGPNEGIAQFVLAAPGARTVHVAGSFNDWRPTALELRDHDRDGVWRADVVLPVGEHEYMFVVDGERWVTDPSAERYVDDGFDRKNSLLIVRPVNNE